MTITAFYAALLAGFFFFLSVRVIRMRRDRRISLGDGGDAELQRRVRVHGNFVEYAPFSLLLIALAESVGTYPLVLHGLGLCLLAGRLFHAYGLGLSHGGGRARVLGMGLSFTVLVSAALACLVPFVAGLVK